MARKEVAVASVAEAYLALLADRGIEYLFANAGTDFAPIVEADAKAAHSGMAAPKPMLATHENLASRRAPTARSSISRSIRCSAAIQSAASPPMSR